jgi:hypothetical protein
VEEVDAAKEKGKEGKRTRRTCIYLGIVRVAHEGRTVKGGVCEEKGQHTALEGKSNEKK